MAFSYVAGSTTPGFGGLAEFSSPVGGAIVLRLNDGMFRPVAIPPLVQTPPLRFDVKPVPRGGGKMSTPSVEAWEFSVDGYFDVSSPDDVQAAIDYLKDQLNPSSGLSTLTLNAKGWSGTRAIAVKLAGQVAVEDPPVDRKKLTRRSFSVPLLAEDPLQYATAQTVTAVTTGGVTVTNAGTAPVTYTAHFEGPNTSFVQMAVGGGSAKVRLDYAIPSGKFVEIDTRAGVVITDVGVDLYEFVTIDSDARFLGSGGTGFVLSSGGGTPTAEVHHYSGWY